MSILEFISSIAWPVTVLSVVLLFRQSLTEMLSGPLERLKAGPVEAVWRDTVSDVKADLSRTEKPIEPEVRPDGISAELESLAERVPSAAVLEGYERIRAALVDVVEDVPIEPPADLNQLSAQALAEVALHAERIRPETVQAVEGLSVLRNLTAHQRADRITPQEARDYLALVDGTLFAIRMNSRRPAERP